MNKIKYDLKLSKTFTGNIGYEKIIYDDDTLVDNKCHYDIFFKEGKIDMVILNFYTYGKHGEKVHNHKILNGGKWNSSFWVKAPKYCHFDDSCWTRKELNFHLNNIHSINYEDGLAVEMCV